MSEHVFREVDVFCNIAFDGNPLAVIHGADGIAEDEMQTIANWTNFSETTFLLEPIDDNADYRVRIFTPYEELPFAGHPTIGSAHAWLEEGGTPKAEGLVVQQCGIGLVTLRNDGKRLAFEAPPLIKSGPADDATRARTLAILGVTEVDVTAVEWIDNGPRWVAAELRDPALLGTLTPSPIDDDEVDITAYALASNIKDVDIEVRCFFGTEIREDPVTGSANAGLAVYFRDEDKIQFPYVAAQGNYMGRDGRVYVSADDNRSLWVAGDAKTVVTGKLHT